MNSPMRRTGGSRTDAKRGIVRNSIGIARPEQVAFDYMTDLEREPDWNPKLKSVRPLTPGPLRAGSRYLVMFDGVGESIIEYLRLDRPNLWATSSSGRRLDVRFVGEVTPNPAGCRVNLQTELSPRRELHQRNVPGVGGA